jgi:hypothetical protein
VTRSTSWTERKDRLLRTIEPEARAFFEAGGVVFIDGCGLGWCPFHEERRTPSFSMYHREDGRPAWRCHGACHTGGDVFDFWQRARQLPDFRTVIEDLETHVGSGTSPLAGGHVDRPRVTRQLRGGPKRSTRKRNRRPASSRVTAIYPYLDAEGVTLYEVLRWQWTDEETGEARKDFSFRQPDPENCGRWLWSLRGVERVPYRLPEVLGAHLVLIVEGEKDAVTLSEWGFAATCIAGGASGWKAEYSYSRWFSGKTVVVIPDLDEAGEGFLASVSQDLLPIAERVLVWQVPMRPGSGADITDWKEAGGTAEELRALLKRQTRAYTHSAVECRGGGR